MPRQGKVLEYDGETGRIICLDEGDIVFPFAVAGVIGDLEAGNLATFDVALTPFEDKEGFATSAINVTAKTQEEGE